MNREEVISHVNQCFEIYDEEKKGYLTPKQLKTLLSDGVRAMGNDDVSGEQLESVMGLIDADKDQIVSYNELQKVLGTIMSGGQYTFDDVVSPFEEPSQESENKENMTFEQSQIFSEKNDGDTNQADNNDEAVRQSSPRSRMDKIKNMLAKKLQKNNSEESLIMTGRSNTSENPLNETKKASSTEYSIIEHEEDPVESLIGESQLTDQPNFGINVVKITEYDEENDLNSEDIPNEDIDTKKSDDEDINKSDSENEQKEDPEDIDNKSDKKDDEENQDKKDNEENQDKKDDVDESPIESSDQMVYRFEKEIFGTNTLKFSNYFDLKDSQEQQGKDPKGQDIIVEEIKDETSRDNDGFYGSPTKLNSDANTVDYEMKDCEIELQRLHDKYKLYLMKLKNLEKLQTTIDKTKQMSPMQNQKIKSSPMKKKQTSEYYPQDFFELKSAETNANIGRPGNDLNIPNASPQVNDIIIAVDEQTNSIPTQNFTIKAPPESMMVSDVQSRNDFSNQINRQNFRNYSRSGVESVQASNSKILLNEELQRAQYLAEISQFNLEKTLMNFKKINQNTSCPNTVDHNLASGSANLNIQSNRNQTPPDKISICDFEETEQKNQTQKKPNKITENNKNYDSVKNEVKRLKNLTDNFNELFMEIVNNQNVMKKAFKNIQTLSPIKNANQTPERNDESNNEKESEWREVDSIQNEINSTKQLDLMNNVKTKLEDIEFNTKINGEVKKSHVENEFIQDNYSTPKVNNLQNDDVVQDLPAGLKVSFNKDANTFKDTQVNDFVDNLENRNNNLLESDALFTNVESFNKLHQKEGYFSSNKGEKNVDMANMNSIEKLKSEQILLENLERQILLNTKLPKMLVDKDTVSDQNNLKDKETTNFKSVTMHSVKSIKATSDKGQGALNDGNLMESKKDNFKKERLKTDQGYGNDYSNKVDKSSTRKSEFSLENGPEKDVTIDALNCLIQKQALLIKILKKKESKVQKLQDILGDSPDGEKLLNSLKNYKEYLKQYQDSMLSGRNKSSKDKRSNEVLTVKPINDNEVILEENPTSFDLQNNCNIGNDSSGKQSSFIGGNYSRDRMSSSKMNNLSHDITSSSRPILQIDCNTTSRKQFEVNDEIEIKNLEEPENITKKDENKSADGNQQNSTNEEKFSSKHEKKSDTNNNLSGELDVEGELKEMLSKTQINPIAEQSQNDDTMNLSTMKPAKKKTKPKKDKVKIVEPDEIKDKKKKKLKSKDDKKSKSPKPVGVLLKLKKKTVKLHIRKKTTKVIIQKMMLYLKNQKKILKKKVNLVQNHLKKRLKNLKKILKKLTIQKTKKSL